MSQQQFRRRRTDSRGRRWAREAEARANGREPTPEPSMEAMPDVEYVEGQAFMAVNVDLDVEELWMQHGSGRAEWDRGTVIRNLRVGGRFMRTWLFGSREKDDVKRVVLRAQDAEFFRQQTSDRVNWVRVRRLRM